MRFLTLYFLFFATVLLGQDGEHNRTVMGFGLEGAFNVLDEPTLSFAEYQAVVGENTFFHHEETANLTKSAKMFHRNGAALRMILKGPDHQNLGSFRSSRFNVGCHFNAGNNYRFKYAEFSRLRTDTVVITDAGGTQTLYRDTIYHTETEYLARSKNLGLFGEYLLYSGEGMPKFITGIGLAADVTMIYQAEVYERHNKETGLYDYYGNPVYMDILVDPSTGTTGYGGFYDAAWDQVGEEKIAMAYYLRPYIPVRIETQLSNHQRLSNFTIDINAKLGTEVQINPGASINARMFYSIGLGLNYYFGADS